MVRMKRRKYGKLKLITNASFGSVAAYLACLLFIKHKLAYQNFFRLIGYK